MKFNEGDLFRWSYNAAEYEKRSDSRNAGTLYWCVSRIFRFNGDVLVDTYWHSGNNKTWTPERAEEQLNLTFLANEADLVKTNYPEYYDSEDIVNLNHPNSSKGNIYVKKTASRSKDAMLEHAKKQLSDAEYEKRYAERSIERFNEKIQEISESGNLDEVWI